MASEVAHPEAINTAHLSDAPMVNGDHDPETDITENSGAFNQNNSLLKSDTNLNPSGPTPIEDVAPGITPIADFIPKGAPTSHPTPPPDEPLVTSEANADVEMTPAAQGESIEAAKGPTAEPAVASTESSLIRPREDDGEDVEEPVAKRSKLETEPDPEPSLVDIPSVDAPIVQSSEALEKEPLTNSGVKTNLDTKTSAETDAPVEESKTDSAVQSDSAPAEAQAAGAAQEAASGPGTLPLSETNKKPEETKLSTMAAPPSTSVAQPAKPSYSTATLTPAQTRFLLEKTKNLKKTKNSQAFLQPVDPVALNIPQYLEIVKNPMDLSTMETKLKAGNYSSVQHYANDFFLIINNARLFNGDAHPVAQAGSSMEAYFRKMMESVPSADQAATPKPQPKKASPKPPSQVQRRESRSAVQASAPAPQAAATNTNATGTGEAFALQPDGTPQIRRDSTINRPARAIKPPPARELTYSKPKRKEHQLELKFCEYVLNDLRSPKYSSFNHVFLAPVDPVALNIPHYRQIVKSPMDLSTMAQKLKQGQYGKATEFKKDFDLMISNCLAFNPIGNPVRDIGIQFQREFETLWKNKDKWERARKADSQRATSASAEEDSADEEEEEEEEEVIHADPQGTIRALQKQLAEMQNALAGLNKPAKQSKSKNKSSAKPTGKKASGSMAASKQKAAPKAKAPKKVRQVTYEEKQEISEAVGKMNGPQVEELTRIITTNCKKYADQEEMELEIDDLPNEVQAMLLKYVRSIFGNPNRGARAVSPDDIAAVDDDDFEPERGNRKGGGSSKRKKHKPMGKKEQQDAIDTLQRKLSQFNGPVASASQSPSNSFAARDDTSGDEESEESEEE